MEDLNQRKLRAEVALLERKWFLHPQYFGGIVTLTIAILSFTAAQMSGFFDQQRLNLRIENQNLQLEVEEKKKQLEKLEANHSDLVADLKTVKDNLSKTRAEILKGAEEVRSQRTKADEIEKKQTALLEMINEAKAQHERVTKDNKIDLETLKFAELIIRQKSLKYRSKEWENLENEIQKLDSSR